MSTITAFPQAEFSRPATGELRLTRRGRLVVFMTALVLALAIGVWLSTTSAATSEAEPTEIVMVGSGETLWDLASERAVDGDVRGMISHIKELNDLESGSLLAGQRLSIPAAE